MNSLGKRIHLNRTLIWLSQANNEFGGYLMYCLFTWIMQAEYQSVFWAEKYTRRLRINSNNKENQGKNGIKTQSKRKKKEKAKP